MNPANSLLHHSYPLWLLRYPKVIYGLYLWNMSIHPRHRLVRQHWLRRLRALPPAAQVLDAGCGEGMHLYPPARRFPRLRFTGIDKLRTHIAFGLALLSKCRLENVELHCLAIEHLPWRQRFDLVLCSGTLQYLADDLEGLRRLSESLRPNGFLLLYVPVNNRQVLPAYQKMMRCMPNYEAAQDRRRIYSREEILEKLNIVGLEITGYWYAGGAAAILSTELYNVFLMLVSRCGRLGWLVMLLAPLVALPVWGLQWLDVFFRKKNGNGLLLAARRAG